MDMLDATSASRVGEGLVDVVGKVKPGGRVLPSKRIDDIMNQVYRAETLTVVGPLYVAPGAPALTRRIAERYGVEVWADAAFDRVRLIELTFA